MRRRDFIGSLAGALVLPRLAWAQKPAAAPADAWPHFRGTPSLTGVSSSQVPAALKRQWVWESGPDVPVDSSPAIVGGVVYVGTAAGELVALGLDDGKLRWRYKAGESIGESSPAVAGGRVFIGDLDGAIHAVNAADGKRVWAYKTQSEIKSSPLVVGDVVLIGSYDASLYALGAADGKQRWTVKTDNYVHGTPAVVDGIAYFAGCDEIFHAVRVSRRTAGFLHVGNCLHRRLSSPRRGRRLLRHVRQPGRRLRDRRAEGEVALRASRPQVPVLFLGGGAGRHGRPRAAAIGWCMRSTRRPARRAGLT